MSSRSSVEGYVEAVADGSIPASLALHGWAHATRALLPTYRWERLEHYADWVGEHCRQTTGDHTGEPLRLLPWQYAVAAQLLCDPACTALLVVVARGAGKTELAASLLCYLMLHDGPGRAYYSVAPTQRAASIIHDRLRALLTHCDPAAAVSATMAIGSTGGWARTQDATYRALPCTEAAMDGLAARLVVADEVARMDRALARVLTGLGKQQSAQLLAITTPDARQQRTPVWPYWSALHAHYTTGADCPGGWRGMLYGLDADDDALEQDHWPKAQPSLDMTVSRGAMRTTIEAMLGTHDPEQVAECDMQVLCRHNDRLSGALDLSLLDRSMQHRTDWAALKGAPAVAAVDMARGTPTGSAHANLSSACLAVWDADHECICVQMVHWWAGLHIEQDERRCHQPLRRWLAEGQLREMPGEVHDMTVIESQLQAWRSIYSLRHVGVDPLSHQESAIVDWRQRGITVTAVDQGIRTMGPAWALWADGLRSQRIHHDRDDVLRQCLAATRTITDNAGNVRPVKGRSAANIDAVVAACMCALLVERYQVARRSSYEGRGEIVL